MSNSKLVAGLAAAVVATALMGAPAMASCRDNNTCGAHQTQGLGKAKHAVKQAMVQKRKRPGVQKTASLRVQKRVHVRIKNGQLMAANGPVKLSGKRMRSSQAMLAAAPRGRGPVVAMIKSMAPRYGVPTWFALRIAQIESGYNPRVRGSAGEYGVFQLKCATARGIGFRGNCGNLLNASTNIQYGLKHLQLAVRSSGGNLKLAASKHNGGLGRKRLVPSYVARVF